MRTCAMRSVSFINIHEKALLFRHAEKKTIKNSISLLRNGIHHCINLQNKGDYYK